MVQISSTPPGAKIRVNGIDRGITPTAIELKKDSDGPSITLIKVGYQERTFQPETKFNQVSILNLFSFLFWGIDAVSGAVWKYDPVYYNLILDPVEDKKIIH